MGMEEEARKRREKLKAMRKAREDGGPPPKSMHEDKSVDALPKPELKLRNYEAQDEKFKESEIEKPLPVHVDDKIKEQLEAAEPKPAVEGDVDLVNLAPKKIDWDLKRAIKDKLDKLERRTQKAIAELIRERLKESNDSADIIDAVTNI